MAVAAPASPEKIGSRSWTYLLLIPIFGLIFFVQRFQLERPLRRPHRLDQRPAFRHRQRGPVSADSHRLCRGWCKAGLRPDFQDKIVFKGTFFWQRQQEVPFEYLRWAENRYVTYRFSRRGYWQTFLMPRPEISKDAIGLPLLGKSLFPKLKAALVEWQRQNGRLEPLPLADMSERVHF
jgi:hypothetical protein